MRRGIVSDNSYNQTDQRNMEMDAKVRDTEQTAPFFLGRRWRLATMWKDASSLGFRRC